MTEEYENPVQDANEAARVSDVAGSDVQPQSTIAVAVERNLDRLLAINGVEGAGIGSDPAGRSVVVVYIRDSATAQRLPTQLEGLRVDPEITGPISAW